MRGAPLPIWTPATPTQAARPIIYAVKALNLHTPEQKAAAWRAVEANRTRWYAAVQRQAAAIFTNEHAAVVRALNDAHASGTLPHTAIHLATAPISGDSGGWRALIEATALAVGATFGRHTASEIAPLLTTRASGKAAGGGDGKPNTYDALLDEGESDLWDIPLGLPNDDLWRKLVQQWLSNAAGLKVKSINATTLAQLQATLAEGVDNGESLADLTTRVDDLYLTSIIPNRSATIARTEVIGASNMGSLFAATAAGVPGLQKMWIATPDARTRPDHADADGQTVALDAPFNVGGAQLDYPGDPSGDPGETINCRCTQGYATADGGSDESADATADENADTDTSDEAEE